MSSCVCEMMWMSRISPGSGTSCQAVWSCGDANPPREEDGGSFGIYRGRLAAKGSMRQKKRGGESPGYSRSGTRERASGKGQHAPKGGEGALRARSTRWTCSRSRPCRSVCSAVLRSPSK